ncbi:MAG: ATP-binding protein [Spartobacteria bacterium]
MSWITVIWFTAAGACLTLGVLHFLVWCWDRSLRASLWFSGVALSVAAIAGIENAIMHANTPAAFLALHRWGHVAFFFITICIVGFVQSYFRTGRRWLIWTLIALRVLVLGLAFVPGPTFNFREVTAMVPFQFFGETLMAPRGVPTPWEPAGEASGLLLVAFVADAAVRLWWKGGRRERQRALVVGSGVALFVFSCFANSILVHGGIAHGGVARAPYFITLSFLFIVAAMAFELSRDMMHAARMVEELRENEESMSLAARAAQLALWRWDISHDDIWVSPNGRGLYGIVAGEPVTLLRFLETLHPDDREATRQAVQGALEGGGTFNAEYRVALPNGGVRWIGALGKVEFGQSDQPLRMRGVSLDITERMTAEMEASQHRAELAHLTRVATLNQLSGSLAHELNQPLAIILSNAQAAQRLLAQSPPDIAEVSEILADIVGEDRRAGEVIHRLRALLKRGETVVLPVSLNAVIEEVLQLTHGDLMARGVVVRCDPLDGLPEVEGDRVQLQQVLLNLILNAADSMSANPPRERRLHLVTAHRNGAVRVSVHDEGCGLPADAEKVFHPFFTTKPHGLGLGLPICRAIIDAHGGKLWSEADPASGSVFHFELPERELQPA